MRPRSKQRQYRNAQAGGPAGMGVGFGSGTFPKPALPQREAPQTSPPLNRFAAKRRPKTEPKPIDIQRLAEMRVVARAEAAKLADVERREYQVARMRELLREDLSATQRQILNHAIRMGKFDAPTLYFIFKDKTAKNAVGILARRMRE